MKQKGKYILLSREEFRDWLKPKVFKRKIRLIQNHHTYLPGYSHFDGKNHFEKVEGMERSHLKRGFGLIAQNLTTFNDGTICLCRDFDSVPCGIKGANRFGICLEHLGNFDLGKDEMTQEHKETIISVNAALCRKFGLKPDTDSIVYHHWYDLKKGIRTDGEGAAKSCPGTGFFGGNTVEAAQKNFIPLVLAEYESLSAEYMTAKNQVSFQGRVTVDADDALNVRTHPDWRAALVKTLENGEIVNVYGEKDGWYQVGPAGQWVSGKYIRKIE